MTLPLFNIISPKINNKMPFFNPKRGIFYFPVTSNYRYYIEATNEDEFGNINYYILLSLNKFDESCRICHIDDYKRCQIHPRGIMLDYIKRETQERGNINCTYKESTDTYDIWLVE